MDEEPKITILIVKHENGMLTVACSEEAVVKIADSEGNVYMDSTALCLDDMAAKGMVSLGPAVHQSEQGG